MWIRISPFHVTPVNDDDDDDDEAKLDSFCGGLITLLLLVGPSTVRPVCLADE